MPLMKSRNWRVVFPALCIFLLAGLSGTATATRSAADLKSEEKAEEVYRKGQTAYWGGDYADTVSLFSRVAAIDPTYKPEHVGMYQQLAAFRLEGTRPGPIRVYQQPVPESRPRRDILIGDEQEWLHLVAEAESVVQAASHYFSRVEESGEVPGEKLSDPRYYLKQARLAYERDQYIEAIRYGHLTLQQLREAFAEATEPRRKVLGKVGDTPVTFNVRGLNLHEALKQLYDLTGVSIVLSAGITGTVTMNVTDVPLREVLDLIVDLNGLRYTERNNVIVIMTPAEYARTAEGLEKKKRKVFPLHFAEAKAIAKVIREAMNMEGITADIRSNSVVVDARTVEEVEEIETLIKQLDMAVNQVLIEAELVEIRYSHNKSLGINWLMQSRMLDSVRLTGPRFGLADSPGPLGGAGGDMLFFGLTHTDFNAVISMLSRHGTVTRLQSPRIMAISGSSAVITSKDVYPYVTITTRTVGEQVIYQYNVETVDVETTFEITPIIQNNRTIGLSMELGVDRVQEIVSIPTPVAGISQDFPIISSREITQDIILWDGETLVVGGIMGQDNFRTESRVPFLGKLPILGNLFKRTNVAEETTELLLFLTPRIVRTYEEGRTITREARATEEEMKRVLPKNILDHKWW